MGLSFSGGLGESLVPAHCAHPVLFYLDRRNECLRRVALGLSFTSLVGDAERGVALWGIVDLAAYVTALVGVGVRGSVGCWCGEGDGRKSNGGAGEGGGGTCLHGDLPGMVG